MTRSRMHKPAGLSMVLAALAALAAPPPAGAVLYGDEIYQNVPGGKFWAFYTEGIAVIDPESCSIETTITKDHLGEPLPNAFNDGVYMQSRDNREGYILIGSRVDETNELGDTVSHMYAISTTDREVITKAEVGPRVVHSYGVYPRGEFWMHSDGEGVFYVIDVDDLSKAAHEGIEAKIETAAHGKLLWDEGAKLGNRGFATTTGEQHLLEINLETKVQTNDYDFSGMVDQCRGLHAIAYSEQNMHVYGECSGGGGALEFDVSGGPGSIEFVQQFPEANGALYETPDGRFVVAASKGMDALFVFVPRGSGKKSSVEYRIDMPGHPSTVSFYTNADDDTVACSPLTENLNQNQRREDGTVACGNAEGCTGASSVADVEAGMCLHDDDGMKLMRILEGSDDSVPATCARCQDATNFEAGEDGEDGTLACVCTPRCGSCDPAPDYSDEDSGYRCINVSDFVRAKDAGRTVPVATLVPNTGGMHQGSPYGSSPECTFGRTYRTHKRGMKYDAAVANIPGHSIVIIDMDSMEKKCTVDLPAAPRKVLFAPNEPVELPGVNVGDAGDDSAARTGSARFAMATAGIGAVVGAAVFGF